MLRKMYPYLHAFLLFLLLTIAPISASASPQTENKSKSLTFTSEYWEGFVDSDGTGLILNLLKRIYEPSGYNVKITVMPIKRGSLALQRGEVDGGIGSFSANYMKKLLIDYKPLTPRYPITISEVTVICHPDHPHSWNVTKSMAGVKYAWPKGYFYDFFLNIPKQKTIRDTAQGIKMVQAKRLDCFLGLRNEIILTAKRLNIITDNFPTEIIAKRSLYILFIDNEVGQLLSRVHDTRMKQLIDSGEIFTLYEQWGQDYQKTKHLLENH